MVQMSVQAPKEVKHSHGSRAMEEAESPSMKRKGIFINTRPETSDEQNQTPYYDVISWDSKDSLRTEAPSIDEDLKNMEGKEGSVSSDTSGPDTDDLGVNKDVPPEGPRARHDCCSHPTVVAWKEDLKAAKADRAKLKDIIVSLESRLAAEAALNQRIPLLEQRIAQQEKEIQLSKQEQDLLERSFASVKIDTDTRMDALKRHCDQAVKDKESMVMRYAKSEKELIELKKEKDIFEKKIKELIKESDAISYKLKVACSEKAKLAMLLDNKNTEIHSLSKEVEFLKEELNARDIKIKWVQNKLKAETDVHKECPGKLEAAMGQITKLGDDLEKTYKENLILQKEIQDYQQNVASEKQLKEEQAKLILERHEHAEREAKLKGLQVKYNALLEEHKELTAKLDQWEIEKATVEDQLKKTQKDLESSLGKISGLKGKLNETNTQLASLTLERDTLLGTCSELDQLKRINDELLSDMASCRSREADMLAFTEKLTTKNVQLQAQYSLIEAKASQLDMEHDATEEIMNKLRFRIADVEKELSEEKSKRAEETRLLAKQVAEKTKKLEATETELEECKGEINSLRNKHTLTLKEMQRELQLAKKKLDSYESSSGGAGSSSDSINQGSRTSSMNSLNENMSNHQPVNFQVDVPPHVLVDRIVRLQHEIARQKEKLDFLEEHNGQLTLELQKKSKLLQNYYLREEAGALTSRTMDSNKTVLQNWSKVKIPAELSKHGGVMSSLYGSKATDDTMTLELSLEINHKLQAILEDTLLKNITLKESIDTLGSEIARLSKQKS